MLAISLHQPHASLMLVDWHRKVYETRTWRTNYRGKLAIHATKKYPPRNRNLFYEEPFYSVLTRAGFLTPQDLPLGMVLGIVEIVGVRPAELVKREVHIFEQAFGDFRKGRYAWETTNPLRFPAPVECKGTQGMWHWNEKTS